MYMLIDKLAMTWYNLYVSLFSSCLVAQLYLTLCDPMDGSMPGFPVHHQLPELAQTHVHWVSDAIQPSHPLSSPASPPAFCLCQHRGLIIIQKMFWPRITLIHCRFVSYICFLLREWPIKLFKYILFLCSWPNGQYFCWREVPGALNRIYGIWLMSTTFLSPEF